MQKLETVLAEKQVDKLWVSSVPQTADYYKRQGFKTVIEGEINGNPKVFMVKELSK
jgi:predicted N-acetyltransferase YhbS